LKDYLDGTKNASIGIQCLSAETEILSAAARNTTNLVEKALQSGLVISEVDYESALRQCVTIVDIFGKQVAEYSQKVSGDQRIGW
jgi:hypothetical protein